ncbi:MULTISPECIES: 2-hydroxyacid dehydrogenase [Pseudoalteromonas]|uniref:Glyoxylate/hydroxypyruvate reductase A n=1 Tax=Pseudoalteromonas amylolytica TaxID=1859457 RepID=A0A1S1MPU6_9GAMM|nr:MULTISPECIES: glyoxylate/hydroxypyruvate reductase A [Pseudoalteromonas]OHU86771.1 glyoxylate/hydroxypyruvate reductase A [Pseudoalteromonas sp. JW3]OHU88704.1 glyoxylate/hydroxypyruvate reductase A [Pseudoalteromonas amylolytica]
MSLLVCVTKRDNTKLLAKLRALLPGVEINEWPHCSALERVRFVLAWGAPDNLWPQLPNLELVQSYGAGVDGIAMELLPEQVVVTRIVDKKLAEDMAEYVLTHVLAHKLRLHQYFSQQTQRLWKPKRAHQGLHVGILGIGELGKVAAKRLIANGFKVSGWSATDKRVAEVNCYAGESQLPIFLSELDYLVCLLPLTEHTKGMLNRNIYEQLPNHCVLINVARGLHVNEEDLLWALNNGELAGACLDVFAQEPLAEGHPFWSHPAITITPHCAALTSIDTACEQIAANYLALISNGRIFNQIDRVRGY